MNVCILDPILDVFKGGNHLSLFAACKDTQFTIVTNRTNPKSPDLPSNTKVITLNKRSGPFYYGFAHFLYAVEADEDGHCHNYLGFLAVVSLQVSADEVVECLVGSAEFYVGLYGDRIEALHQWV